MHLPRWYPDLVELSDGRYAAVSGNSTDSNTWADTPEVYDPTANTWTLLPNVSTSQVHEEDIRSHTCSNGKVFTIRPSEDKSFFFDVNNQTWTPVGSSGVVNGSSVMYQPGKILYSGGAASVINTTPAQAGSAVIDLNAANPAWATSRAHALRARSPYPHHAGGRPRPRRRRRGHQRPNPGNNRRVAGQMWDPATGQWTVVASMSAARNYHSTAILMPDGTVLVAGGGHGDEQRRPGSVFALRPTRPRTCSMGRVPR